MTLEIPRDAREHTLPGSYLLHVATLVQRWSVSESALFEGTGLRHADLADPAFVVPVSAVVAVAQRARVLTGEPGLGLYLGLDLHIPAHGYPGFAAMSSTTLRDAIAMAIAYAPLRTTAFAFDLKIEGPMASLVVVERADLGLARDVLLMTLLVGLWQLGNFFLGREAHDCVVHLTLPFPEYYRRYEGVGPVIHFGTKVNRLYFDAARLEWPLATADAGALQLVRSECDRQLAALAARAGFAGRVQPLVCRSEGGLRSLDEIATMLQVSTRTARRRLAEEHTSFAAVRDRELRDRATILLRSRELSLEAIAQRLGYEHMGNFTRAFRRWTGQAPSDYRKSEASRTRD